MTDPSLYVICFIPSAINILNSTAELQFLFHGIFTSFSTVFCFILGTLTTIINIIIINLCTAVCQGSGYAGVDPNAETGMQI